MPRYLVIDRERDAFLAGLGGRGHGVEIPDIFVFVWQGQVVKFHVFIINSPVDGQGVSHGVDIRAPGFPTAW